MYIANPNLFVKNVYFFVNDTAVTVIQYSHSSLLILNDDYQAHVFHDKSSNNLTHNKIKERISILKLKQYFYVCLFF